MAKLIERVGTKTLVDGKAIDLSMLVNMGSELIEVGAHRSPMYYFIEAATKEAQNKALGITDSYRYGYVIR